MSITPVISTHNDKIAHLVQIHNVKDINLALDLVKASIKYSMLMYPDGECNCENDSIEYTIDNTVNYSTRPVKLHTCDQLLLDSVVNIYARRGDYNNTSIIDAEYSRLIAKFNNEISEKAVPVRNWLE